MTALEEITPRVEQYSIDEMFLDLTGIDGCEDFEHFGRRLRAHVLATTGLTVGVGMGPTKTLAKIGTVGQQGVAAIPGSAGADAGQSEAHRNAAGKPARCGDMGCWPAHW